MEEIWYKPIVPTRSTTPRSPPRTFRAAWSCGIRRFAFRNEFHCEVVHGFDILLHRRRPLSSANGLDGFCGNPKTDGGRMVRVPHVLGRPVLRHDKDRQLVQLRRHTREPLAACKARAGARFLCEVPSAGGNHHQSERTTDITAWPAENALHVFFLLWSQLVPVVGRLDAIAPETRDRLPGLDLPSALARKRECGDCREADNRCGKKFMVHEHFPWNNA